jgi:hypothetical protein
VPTEVPSDTPTTENLPSIEVSISADVATAHVSDQIHYTYVIHNTGSGPVQIGLADGYALFSDTSTYSMSAQSCRQGGEQNFFPITLDPDDGASGGSDELICHSNHDVSTVDLSHGSVGAQFHARPTGGDWIDSEVLEIPVS